MKSSPDMASSPIFRLLSDYLANSTSPYCTLTRHSPSFVDPGLLYLHGRSLRLGFCVFTAAANGLVVVSSVRRVLPVCRLLLGNGSHCGDLLRNVIWVSCCRCMISIDLPDYRGSIHRLRLNLSAVTMKYCAGVIRGWHSC